MAYAAASDPANALTVGEEVSSHLVDAFLSGQDDDETNISINELEEAWGTIVQVRGKTISSTPPHHARNLSLLPVRVIFPFTHSCQRGAYISSRAHEMLLSARPVLQSRSGLDQGRQDPYGLEGKTDKAIR